MGTDFEPKEVIVNLPNAASALPDEWKEPYQQAILEPAYVHLTDIGVH